MPLLEYLLFSSDDIDTTVGFDLFHRNHRGQTFVDRATSEAAAHPHHQERVRVAILRADFFLSWQRYLLPGLHEELASGECTGLPMDLVDLVTQYADGHGRPFEEKDNQPEAHCSAVEPATTLANGAATVAAAVFSSEAALLIQT